MIEPDAVPLLSVEPAAHNEARARLHARIAEKQLKDVEEAVERAQIVIHLQESNLVPEARARLKEYGYTNDSWSPSQWRYVIEGGGESPDRDSYLAGCTGAWCCIGLLLCCCGK